jgi:RNA polymerase sigma-70 factor (ECF subfamily)
VDKIAALPFGEGERKRVLLPWNDEGRLLKAIRAGDRAAAEEIVERTYTGVFASLYQLCGDRELAADLTQETYQKAWTALGDFDGRSRVYTWLYRIAYRTFLNHIRTPNRTTSLDAETSMDVRDTAPSAEDVVRERAESDSIQRAVMGLPDDLRFTVTAHFWGGLEVKEVAKIEGVTPAAIRRRLHVAFEQLGPMLEGSLVKKDFR